MESINSINTIGKREHKQQILREKSILENDEIPNHDGGYAWVVVICSFFVCSVMSFNALSFGIFISEFQHTFGWSDAELGVVGSCRLGLSTVAGLFSGPLVQKYGCRLVTIFAICLSAVGHVVAAFSSNKIIIYITFGIFAGIGAGLSAIPSIILVQRYFTKRRAVAAALASVGFGFFGIISSPVTRLLVSAMGWRGALLILGGFNVQMLVPAAMYRPAPILKTIENSSDSASHDGKMDDKPAPRRNFCAQKMCDIVSYYMDKELFQKKFMLYIISQLSRAMLVDSLYLRLAPIGVSIGLDPLKASLLPSVVAICTTVNRALGGVIAKALHPTMIYGLFNLCAALFAFCIPFVPRTFVAYVILSVLFGISVGMVFGIEHTCLVSLIGVDRLPLGLSWICLCTGVTRVSSNVLVGWLLDKTGSYDVPIWFASGIHFIGGIVALTIAIIIRREDARGTQQTEKQAPDEH